MDNRETELRVADVFAMFLKAFVPILCVVLAFALIGCAYGWYAARHKAPVTEADVAAAADAARMAEEAYRSTEFAVAHANEVELPALMRQIEENEAAVQKQKTLIENSLLQAIDPFRCGVSRRTMQIVGASQDKLNAIAAAYEAAYRTDETVVGALRAALNTTADAPYLLELVQVHGSSDGVIEIIAIHEDPAAAERMADAILPALHTSVGASVAPHKLETVGSVTGYEVNWELDRVQTERKNQLMLAENALADVHESYRTLVSSNGKREQAIADTKVLFEEALSKQSSLKKQYTDTVLSHRAVTKRMLLFGVLGAAIGLILACVAVLLKNLLNGKLHNQTECRSRFACPILAILPREKRIPLQKAVQKLEGDPIGSFPAQAQAAAQSLLMQIGDRSVCLISSLGTDAAEKLSAYTGGKMPIAGDLLTDANAVSALAACDGAILIEQRDRSRIALIDAELDRAAALQKDVLGIVLL